MKLKIIDENNFILFIIDPKIMPDITKEKELSEYLKKIFQELNKKCDLEIFGYYNVTIYACSTYGIIIKFIKNSDECFSYYSKQIEMKIVINNDNLILYKLADLNGLNDDIVNNSNLYLYDKNLYLELTNKCDFIILGNLIEFADVIFENTRIIKNKGEKIEIR